MAVIISLLIGNETWQLQERCLESIRAHHPKQDIIVYYSLSKDRDLILKTLNSLQVEAIDIGQPGLLGSTSPGEYSNYNSLAFNIKTSFKWLALLGALSSRLEDVIFIDADIVLLSPLPLDTFAEIWEHYDILIQDEGTNIFPKHACTGFMGIKCCETNLTLLERLHKEQCAAIVSGMSMHDQSIFHSLISSDAGIYKRIYFLPQLLFPVGYMGPVYKRFGNPPATLSKQPDPILYHANWVVGIEQKVELMDAMAQEETQGHTRRILHDIQAAGKELETDRKTEPISTRRRQPKQKSLDSSNFSRTGK